MADPDLLYRDESYKIVGCAMEVHNTLGFGLLEKPYENALTIEFELRGIPFEQQKRYDVLYKNKTVGNYIPDLVVFGKIILDTKAIEQIGAVETAQMLNYLKITNLKLGLIINFKNPKLEWIRIVL
jgi:GxxExxY protein